MFAKNLKYIAQTYSTIRGTFFSVPNTLNETTRRLSRKCILEKMLISKKFEELNGISSERYKDEIYYKKNNYMTQEIYKLTSNNDKNWHVVMEMCRTHEIYEKLLENADTRVPEFVQMLEAVLYGQNSQITPSFHIAGFIEGSEYWKPSEEVIFPTIKTNSKCALKIGAKLSNGFLCRRNPMNFKVNSLLSSHSLSSVASSGAIGYCTQASGRRHKNRPNKLVNEDIPNETSELNESSVAIQHSRLKDGVPKLFPNSKHTLGNIYHIIEKEKGSHDIWLSSTFRQVKKNWTCTYKIKWPGEMSFSHSGDTKKKAAEKCASLVLHHLLENRHINMKGTPMLFDKKDIQALVQGNIPALNLNQNHMEKLEKITSLYSQQISPVIESSKNITKLEIGRESFLNESNTYEQKFLGYEKYKVIEELHLPVSDFKEEIIQRIQNNRVLIVKGEPGCGKSTRVPQYILESWAREAETTDKPCKIVVTEPRRIAAISLADRVASERNEKVGDIVGYKVRFKSNFQSATGRIMYCTNGVLLQHFKSDPSLSNFTHVVIDEAHERDINTDLLLNMLRKVLKDNPSLKVVIMSATIDTELFQKYFEESSLIHIPGFTYPVKSYFLDELNLHMDKTNKMCNESDPVVVHDEVVKLLMHLHRKKPEGAILCFLPGWEDIRKIRDSIPPKEDVMVLCLHSRLQDLEQWRIFEKSPEGVRKIILATNIAETSVTINDVVYVVDTGIHKETRFDIDKGLMCIDNHWVSRSSVDQRKGRAGRVTAGECFHLYPKNKLESLPQFSLPEVLRVSLTKVVLDSKAFNSEMTSLEFFNNLPSPPKDETVKLAVGELVDLELLDINEQLTPLGEVLHKFQLEPKLAKTLVNSVIYKCVSPVVDIITLFSSGTNIFRSGLERKEDIRKLKASFSKSSDHLSLMRIFEIWNDFIETGDERKAERFSEDLSLLQNKMNLMKALKKIHLDYIRNGLKRHVLPISDDFSDEDEVVKATLLSGVGSFLSCKNWDIVKGRVKKDSILLTRTNQKATVTPDSVNFRTAPNLSQFLLYINETRSNMRRVTLIREASLIPAITVLLFSNKEVILQEIDRKQFSPKLTSEDQVMLKLGETKISFVLDREQALKIMECKLALASCYDHYIFQLTEGGRHNPTLDALWNDLLGILCDLLNDFKTD